MRAAAAHAATAALCPAEQRCPGRAAPPSPSRPPTTTAAAHATTAAGGGAVASAGGAAAQPHQAALLLLLLLLLLVLQMLLVEVRLGVLEVLLVPEELDLLLTVTACHGHYHGSCSNQGWTAAVTASPGRPHPSAASESAVAPGAGESAAALGARESTDALGASASTAIGPASAEAFHTFTLDSGASRCFFRDCTTVTPLAALVPVSLADPTGGPVVARASTVLPCPAVPSVSLSGLHLPALSTNLLSNAVLQDEWTLLWHHRLGHPSLSRLRSMHSCLLVSGLPRSLPSLPRSPAPPCLPCVEGRQRAAPHSSEFLLTIAPVQTLHMDVWGPAPVGGKDQERYFLLVVDDYTRYTIVFPLRRKADVNGVLIPWICATRRQLRERFRWDFHVLRLHSDRSGEFSSDLLAEFCRDEGIHQSSTLPASPQQNGIAERRIGLIMELNLWAHVSEPETSPTLRWTGKVGDASVFR
ncbi:unnamed protein product, partial [Closterium sp. NIES-54]